MAHLEHADGAVVCQHACKIGPDGIVPKRPVATARSPDWLKFKDPAAPAVKRKAEEGEMRKTATKVREHFPETEPPIHSRPSSVPIQARPGTLPNPTWKR